MSFPQIQQPAVGPTVALAHPHPCRIALTLFDADQLTEAVRDAGFEHRQLHPGSFRGELVRAEVGGLLVDRGYYSQTLLARGSFSSTRITIGFLLSDREPGYINGIRSRAHDLIVFPETEELDYVLPAATEWCTVQIERDELLSTGIPEDSLGRMSVVSPRAGQHARLARFMRTTVDGRVHAQEQHAFRDALLEELYQAIDPQLNQCRRANFCERADLLRRFERLVDAQEAQRHSIAELARALGVGRRTLEEAFRDYVGLSPARYVAVLRLNAMRRELLNASEDNLRVADLAARYGVVHLGRFAGDYRQMFGELPSQTLRRAPCEAR
jgi:AraC family ethanolamine operon transcriptional activator